MGDVPAPNTIPIPTYPGSGGIAAAVTIADGANTTQGSIADAAVSTDAAGTLNAHLRGIVKLLAAGIAAAITVVDGGDVTQGATTDAAVSTDANGSVNGHIRGLVKLLAGALGTAGSAASSVVSIQGIGGGNSVAVQEATFAVASNGVFVPTASATQMPTVSAHLVYITAIKANTGTIYLGRSSAVTTTVNANNTTTGLELQAGQQVGPLPISNLNEIWAIGTVATDAITYMVL